MNPNTNVPSPSAYKGTNPGSASSAAVADDFHKVVNEAESLVKAIGDEGSAQLNQVRDRLTGAIKTAKDKLMTWEKDAAEYTKRTAAAADQYVHENPWKSVAISAAVGTTVGVLLGVLIGRR